MKIIIIVVCICSVIKIHTQLHGLQQLCSIYLSNTYIYYDRILILEKKYRRGTQTYTNETCVPENVNMYYYYLLYTYTAIQDISRREALKCIYFFLNKKWYSVPPMALSSFKHCSPSLYMMQSTTF